MERLGNYRFMSSYDEFRKCVDIAKTLLEKKKLTLLFGYQKKVKFRLWLNTEQFRDEYPDLDFQDFRYILHDEIAYIIEQNIVAPELEEPSLVEFLHGEGFDETVIPKMVQEKADKRKYVQEKILLENAQLRYRFKEKTLINKLSGIQYEINKYVFTNNLEMPYAVVEFASVDKLGARDVSDILFSDKATEKVKFVCDKEDLEYIIMRLEQIKEKL